MAGQAALEIQRRRKCELEAQMKVAKLRMELPGLEKSLEKTLLNRGLKRGLDLDLGR